MNLQWTGENLMQQVIGGVVTINVSEDDIDFIQQFVSIPEEYLSLVQMAMMLSGGQLPVKMTLTDTITATYDDMYNPMFCNWGEIFSSKNLSLNNVLTMKNNGAFKLSVALMGQETDLFNQPQNSEQSYTYEYNDKKYPTKVVGDGEVVYTYKE